MFDLLIFPLCLLQLISLIVVRPLATMVSLIRIFPILASQRISETGFADSLPYPKTVVVFLAQPCSTIASKACHDFISNQEWFCNLFAEILGLRDSNPLNEKFS